MFYVLETKFSIYYIVGLPVYPDFPRESKTGNPTNYQAPEQDTCQARNKSHHILSEFRVISESKEETERTQLPNQL